MKRVKVVIYFKNEYGYNSGHCSVEHPWTQKLCGYVRNWRKFTYKKSYYSSKVSFKIKKIHDPKKRVLYLLKIPVGLVTIKLIYNTCLLCILWY